MNFILNSKIFFGMNIAASNTNSIDIGKSAPTIICFHDKKDAVLNKCLPNTYALSILINCTTFPLLGVGYVEDLSI